MSNHDELIRMSAVALAENIRRDAVSPLDLIDALEARVAAVDPRINALPTLCFERAREAATRVRAAAPEARGSLQGIPVAIKDLTEVENVRTTHGSKLHEDDMPQISDRLIQAIETAGGVVYAKSNTPEFGVGGNTFNDVFGATRNPYDTRLSAGGSSGGAAAALAYGGAWLATGSDMGGSLRTPASFCGVASLRPGPGLIESDPTDPPFQVLALDGPMARDVRDVALLADAMTNGPRMIRSDRFQAAAARPSPPRIVAFSADLGLAKVEPRIIDVCRGAASALERQGVMVEETHPPLAEAHDAFWTLRAVASAIRFGHRFEAIRDIIKPELTLDIARGLTLSGSAIREAMAKQGRIVAAATQFMNRYDMLICPAVSLQPFPVEQRYPGYGEDTPYEEYLRWLELAYAITVTSLPVITLPCGKTDDGMPVGLQLIGKPYGEQTLFSAARAIEEMLAWDPAPIDPA